MLEACGYCVLDNVKAGIWIAGNFSCTQSSCHFLSDKWRSNFLFFLNTSIELQFSTQWFPTDLQLVRCPVCELNTCDGKAEQNPSLLNTWVWTLTDEIISYLLKVLGKSGGLEAKGFRVSHFMFVMRRNNADAGCKAYRIVLERGVSEWKLGIRTYRFPWCQKACRWCFGGYFRSQTPQWLSNIW